ncbi:MAG: hypothetical protein K6G30_12795 [Acetatifactor sp.]|nr:hypothetical protein [Acetatifactor sp.]
MEKCNNCNIFVYDDTGICPLCHSVLGEPTKEDEEKLGRFSPKASPYPDLKKRARILRFLLRLILFLFILAEALMVGINYYVTPGVWWSGICGVSMAYIYLSVVYWIRHDAGYAAKVGLQLTLTILLLFGIDYFTGMNGWSLQWAIPGVILVGDAIVFLLMMLNREQWYSYTILLLMIGLFSVVIIALYFLGVIANIVLPILCVGVTGAYILGTFLLGDREFTREMKRRFYV